jgi:acylphosphatase
MADEHRIARMYYVSGSVQGVGFRHFARRTAQILGVGGYAKNLRDGRVEIYGIGSAANLDEFRRRLEQGPPAAAVWEIAEEAAQLLPRYGSDFSIEHEGW